MIDSIKISLAMRGGLSAVCATCTRFWEARDKGIPEPRCMARTRCGSPMAGDDFHEYDGPLEGALDKLCFVCGELPRFGVRLLEVGRPTKIVGVCVRHLQMLVEMRPTEPGVRPPRFEILTEDGHPVSMRPDAQTKSVAKAIYEVETYYAKKHGYEPDL